MVNTILREADLFCPNSVRINFTIYLAAGDSLDETYGLVEKSALIYTTIRAQGGEVLQSLTDKDFRDLIMKANEDFLTPDAVGATVD